MESNQVEQIIALYGSKVLPQFIPELRGRLANADYSVACAYMAKLKDPTVSLILSIVVGTIGVDRFYVGDIGLGVLKLLTCGGCGVWWLVDIFMIREITLNRNWLQLQLLLS